MELDITTIITIFSILFIGQTILYTILLLKLKNRVDKTVSKSQTSQTTSQQEDEVKINESIVKALEILTKGPLSAREVSINLGLSREHTARLLKKMVETGLVVREGKPYRYKITPTGEALIKNNLKYNK
ncbi:MAG: winged helix DNA-binding protein [Aigarchaeota archaeon]|nr:winged helix DNA-binding protein [Aigarchaeota archaeon]MCX8192426.1 winged helix DNA-binding protein [Nitrososphaeria archaeon]MDW7986632.1 helix-turn-helix domain-containing protein [Nitrososphaerota archaeon]